MKPPAFIQRPSTVTPNPVGPPSDFRPPAIRRSETAAKAAQYVEELEEEVGRLTQDMGQLKNMLQLEEERNKVLTGDLKTAQLDRDYYQRRATEIMTSLTISANIILSAMKEPPEREDKDQRARITEAAYKALHGDTDDQD